MIHEQEASIERRRSKWERTQRTTWWWPPALPAVSGRTCVEAFAATGARVVMADIDPAGQDLAAELGEAQCRFVEADVADEKHVQQIISTAMDAFGGLDVLVNNAAYCSVDEPVQTTSQADC